MMNRYNGWTNYETWVTALWIDNEESTQRYWTKRARELYDEAEDDNALSKAEKASLILADELRESHEEAQPDLEGVFSDLMSAALSEVDWYEIADSYICELARADYFPV